METLITLKEWAALRGRSYGSIRNTWTRRDDFPAPKRTRPRTGRGTPAPLYEAADLDAFADCWEAAHRPTLFPMPEGPDEFRTLGAIAHLLGVNSKTVTQYRRIFDKTVDHEDRGSRTIYRTRGVIDTLNTRLGMGMARPHLQRSPGNSSSSQTPAI
ncbi:hypothetical protein ACL02S_23165 [Nocardia sp. 004]|uniref:hypothetical protein n=1 Tax=Nocardia sp. 004 TaxID=3385978 RepID=UPI0039A2A5AB